MDEYATYFVAGDAQADAVWVHNECYRGRPDGFNDTGELTDFGQVIIREPNKTEAAGSDSFSGSYRFVF